MFGMIDDRVEDADNFPLRHRHAAYIPSDLKGSTTPNYIARPKAGKLCIWLLPSFPSYLSYYGGPQQASFHVFKAVCELLVPVDVGGPPETSAVAAAAAAAAEAGLAVAAVAAGTTLGFYFTLSYH